MIASPSIAFNEFSGSANDVTDLRSKTALGYSIKLTAHNAFVRLNCNRRPQRKCDDLHPEQHS